MGEGQRRGGRLTLQQPNRRKTPSGGRTMARRTSRNVQPFAMAASELIGSEAGWRWRWRWRPEICSPPVTPGFDSSPFPWSVAGRAGNWEFGTEDECQSWTQQQFLHQPFSMPGKRALRLDHRDAKPFQSYSTDTLPQSTADLSSL